MLICHCHAVNDKVIRDAAADGRAMVPEDLAELCGAGARCGGCLPALRAMLAEVATDRPARDLTVAWTGPQPSPR